MKKNFPSVSIIEQTIADPSIPFSRVSSGKIYGPALIYRLQFHDEGVNVHLKGRLTFAERGTFRDLLYENHGDAKQMILDMRDVVFMDSSGLGMLLIANDQLTKKGMKLLIKGAYHQVAHVLRAAQVDKIIPVEFPDVN
jgi:HptB-dependent secretion and biofilm anti anti-sigma factor